MKNKITNKKSWIKPIVKKLSIKDTFGGPYFSAGNEDDTYHS